MTELKETQTCQVTFLKQADFLALDKFVLSDLTLQYVTLRIRSSGA